MKCPACGNEVPPESRFCNGCGGRLTSEGISFTEKPEYEEESQRRTSSNGSWLAQYYSDWGFVESLVGLFLLVFFGLVGGVFLVLFGWSSDNLGIWFAGVFLVIVGSLAIFPLRVLLKDLYKDSPPHYDPTYRGKLKLGEMILVHVAVEKNLKGAAEDKTHQNGVECKII